MRPNENRAFDDMVEALEENEDMVECKECFDLFPKTECSKTDVGYICPVCKHACEEPRESKVSSRDITVDLYNQEFPEVCDYDPGTVRDYSAEPSVNDALSALLADEYDAVDRYEVADETIQHAPVPEEKKDEILDAIEHIKEEEEEHIDELKELMQEDSDMEEAFGGEAPAPEGVGAPILADHDAEEGEETTGVTLNEGPFNLKDKVKRLGRNLKKKVTKVKNNDYNTILSRVFYNGYYVRTQVDKITDETMKKKVKDAIARQNNGKFASDAFADAMQFATTLSKSIPGALSVHVIAAAIDIDKFGLATSNIIDVKGNFANIIATYRAGKVVTDNSKTLASKIYEAAEDDDVLGAILDGEDPRDVFAGDFDTDVEEPVEAEEETTEEETTEKSDPKPAEEGTETDETGSEEATTEEGEESAEDSGEGETKSADDEKAERKKYLGHSVSDKAVHAFRKFMIGCGLEVKIFDAFNKPVAVDKDELMKIKSDNLIDYEIELAGGKRMQLASWIEKMVQNKVISESFFLN